MAQLNYSFDTPKGVAGGLADISFSTVASRANEENDGVLKFGMAVKKGTTAGTQVKKPTSGTTAADIEGIVVRHANTEESMDGTAVVKKGATVSVMKQGRIWARTSEFASVTPGAKAYLIVDRDEAGFFTDKSAQYQYYVKCESTDDGAKKVVASGATSGQINLESVTPVQPSTYTPAANDYVKQVTAHGAPIDIGAVFGEHADEGIAIVNVTDAVIVTTASTSE